MRVAALLFFPVLASGAAEEFAGRWEGSVRLPARSYDLVVDLDQTGGKDWVGSVIIPGLDIKGAPLDQLAIEGGRVSFALLHALSSPRIEAPKFEARLTSADELSGEFVQAGNRAPFVVRKTGPPQVELPRKSTPIGKNWDRGVER